MAQTATFTQVEKLEEIAEQNAMLTLQRSSSAGALVGRTVSYTDERGATTTGAVTSVRLGTGTTEATRSSAASMSRWAASPRSPAQRLTAPPPTDSAP